MTEKVRFGPANPHPLSQLKTELVWDGKYDEYGNRRVVDIAGCAMPTQKIETIAYRSACFTRCSANKNAQAATQLFQMVLR
jgi:hypothetical protein